MSRPWILHSKLDTWMQDACALDSSLFNRNNVVWSSFIADVRDGIQVHQRGINISADPIDRSDGEADSEQ